MKRTILFAVALLLAVQLPLEAQDVQRFVRYEQGGQISWGELVDGTIHQLSDAPYLDGERTGEQVALSSVTLKAPVDPTQIFMTGFNFLSHISGEPAEYPGLFLVPPTSIIGPEEPIIHPDDTESLHYEAEMVAVVADTAINVPLEDAGDYVFGVSAGNDVSARDWQSNDIQWSRAKGSRGFNAVGPYLVRGLDYSDLDIEGRLNGEVRQEGGTHDLLFDIDYMVHYISQYFILLPGDLIWTGTMGTTASMTEGDVYEVEVEGVGILRNPVVMEGSP